MICVPGSVVGIRLVRRVAKDLRCYEPVRFTRGSAGVCTTLRQCLIWEDDPARDYGMADLIDDEQDIVVEINLDRDQFQRLKKKLKCRVED